MQKSFRPTVGALVFTIVSLIILLSLGSWQVVRLGEKTAFLDLINSKMSNAPVPMPNSIDSPKDWEYSRVTLAGSFLHNHQFLIKPRTLDGMSGAHMFVPFKRLSGNIVLVNRGWISEEFMNKASRPKGIIKIEGIVRLPYKTSFTPENNPATGDWYWADINAMAYKAGLKNVAPVFVNIAKRKTGVYPAGGKVTVNIHNNHLFYAFFWFSMAAILQIVFFLSSRKPVKKNNKNK